jgi:hypothetical protein
MQGRIHRCFECAGEAHHQHHVVPRVHGGTKTVWLCSPCHGLAHSHNMPLPKLIKEGIAKARLKNGGQWGRTRQLPYPEIIKLYDKGMSGGDIARKLGIKVNSVYGVLRRIRRDKK